MRKPLTQSRWVACTDLTVSRCWTEPWPSCGFLSHWCLQCSALPCCDEQLLTVVWDSVQTSCWEDCGYRWVSIEICGVEPSYGLPGFQQTLVRKKQWIYFTGLWVLSKITELVSGDFDIATEPWPLTGHMILYVCEVCINGPCLSVAVTSQHQSLFRVKCHSKTESGWALG